MMQDTMTFLTAIGGDDVEARFAAWRGAADYDASVVQGLLAYSESPKPGVAKAAAEALTTMTHAVGKDARDPKRGPLVKALLAKPSALSFRLLSLIAGEEAVPAIARSLGLDALREEVVYCLERIPGAAADKALIGAYATAKEEFKPRILAALGHRRSVEALSLCMLAMGSGNAEISLAGTKAFGRIGSKPAGALKFPKTEGLGVWQRFDSLDAQLRYADAQRSIEIYREFLERPEGHYQCAALVGLAKIGGMEAAQAIYPKLRSGDRVVRVTAERAWARVGRG